MWCVFLSNAIGGGRWRFMRGMRCTLMTAAASHCGTCVCFNTVGVIQVSSCAEVPCRRCRVCWFCCVRRICYFGFGRRILSSATRDAETFLLSRICERVCEKQDGDEFSAPPTTTCEVASIHDCRFIAGRQSMLASSNLPAATALVTTEVR
jgi:hypothetical protein